MKNLKKIAAVLAAVSMWTVCSAQVVSAADAITVSADKVTADAGAEFTLAVKLADVPSGGISAADFAVNYDASAITITGVTAGDIVNTKAEGNFDDAPVFEANFDDAGVITVLYGVASNDTSSWVTADGTFLTISGKVNEGTADGTYKVDIVGIDRPLYEDAGKQNTEAYFGCMTCEDPDADNPKYTTIPYTVKAVSGSVTVGKGGSDVPSGDVLKGDADCSGEINILDVIAINRVVLGKATFNDQEFANADVDNDDVITAADSLKILKYLVKIIDNFD